jgi:hypothetical protein
MQGGITYNYLINETNITNFKSLTKQVKKLAKKIEKAAKN